MVICTVPKRTRRSPEGAPKKPRRSPEEVPTHKKSRLSHVFCGRRQKPRLRPLFFNSPAPKKHPPHKGRFRHGFCERRQKPRRQPPFSPPHPDKAPKKPTPRPEGLHFFASFTRVSFFNFHREKHVQKWRVARLKFSFKKFLSA